MAVSLVALATMVLWHAPMIQRRRSIAVIPAPLLGVLMGTLVNELLCHFVPNVGLTAVSGHLLQIPDGGIKGLFMQLPTPRWDVITRADTWDIALAIALIASVESLLSVEATDKMAPDHPHANVHRELMAQGVGNMLCGAVGALPMASVMLRNSANIYGGGESRWPSFFHGILLLVAVALVPDILEHIPLAALAVVIIHVGARLININMVRQVWREGVEQIAPFWVTFVAIMVTDLAVGVAIGMAVGLLIVLRMNHHSAMTVVRDGDDMLRMYPLCKSLRSRVF